MFHDSNVIYSYIASLFKILGDSSRHIALAHANEACWHGPLLQQAM